MASLTDDGRAGIVCPQGVLFRGQPEVEDETDEFDDSLMAEIALDCGYSASSLKERVYALSGPDGAPDSRYRRCCGPSRELLE
jgi:hypothetical protein